MSIDRCDKGIPSPQNKPTLPDTDVSSEVPFSPALIASTGHQAAASFERHILTRLRNHQALTDDDLSEMLTWFYAWKKTPPQTPHDSYGTFEQSLNAFQFGREDPEAMRIRLLAGFAGHDIAEALTGFSFGLEMPDEDLFRRFIHPAVAQWIYDVIESTSREVEMKPANEYFDPTKHLQDVVEYFKIIDMTGISFNLSVNREPFEDAMNTQEGQLFGDPLYLKRTIYNLVKNAQKKLSRDESTGLKSITIHLTHTPYGTTISVHDTGDGFDPDLLEEVIDQSDNQRKQKAFIIGETGGSVAGRGFGLGIVDDKMHNHFHGTAHINNDDDGRCPIVTLQFPPPHKA